MNDHERSLYNESELNYLRDLFIAEIKRIDEVFAEREKQVNLAMSASQKAIDKAEIESERSRQASNEWRAAMNDRERQFVHTELHERLQTQVDAVITRQDQARGRSSAWVAAAGIIATLLAIGVGQLISQGITSADVSNQIQREAPWNRDKSQIERRILILEAQEQRLQLQISNLQNDLQAHVLIDARK